MIKKKLYSDFDKGISKCSKEEYEYLDWDWQVNPLCLKSNAYLVQDFHNKFKLPVGEKICIPDDDRKVLRLRLMLEELAEVSEAMSLKDIPKLAKELCDLLYVVYGTAVECGLPIDELFREVHKSNMTKTLSLDDGGKLTKGNSYVPPDLETILKAK